MSSSAAKPKVPFHISSIRRPQDEYRIIVNNDNNFPFNHVWLEQNEDGTHFHPLEKVSDGELIGTTGYIHEPVKPLSLEETPFKLVEELKDLREMCAKLKNVTEIAVDLEHNQYRSFQGLTCLMQISTRTEDFIVDTLKLRIYIGLYLREIFKDPKKMKVMHGADRDILWLQRDFGIYVVNLFDTRQASQLLQLEKNSLEYLLHHFCNVEANKEYQNADWRQRPLPDVMLRYAREDTHYLLYIYDLMRNELLAKSPYSRYDLLEVYNRSRNICLQLYQKELYTDTSYLNIYGLENMTLNAAQLAIVSGLYHWRDYVARAEDESTGYILPNKLLLEIAKEMPLTSDKLLQLVKSRHTAVERYVPTVLGIIRNSISNPSDFEATAMELKQAQLEKARAAEIEAREVPSSEVEPLIDPVTQVHSPANIDYSSSYPLSIPGGVQQVNPLSEPYVVHTPANVSSSSTYPWYIPRGVQHVNPVAQQVNQVYTSANVNYSSAYPLNIPQGVQQVDRVARDNTPANINYSSTYPPNFPGGVQQVDPVAQVNTPANINYSSSYPPNFRGGVQQPPLRQSWEQHWRPF